MAALSDCEVTEFAGIEPNPEYATCMKAVEIIKEKSIDFVLAVGGGSVIDGSKFIVAAAKFEGEPWDIMAKSAEIKETMPLGVVLTLPATGSEMNFYFVVSRRETGDKLACANEKVFPQFSILDPSVTYTLPTRQVSNGVVDAFTHTMEQYLTYPVNAPLQDRFAEGLLHTLIEEGPKTVANPEDYDARANMMWCATLALNTLICSGVPQDWATHMIGHEITAMHGLDHAQTLAIVLPRMMDYKRAAKREKLLQYAERIWNITEGDEESRIDQAIAKTKDFFERVGVKTNFNDYGVTPDTVPALIAKLEEHGMTAIGERQDVTLADSQKVLENCFA
jgi:NADP-dependent alcohol dehydrogenase